ncbi:hypothetical protein SAMN04488024_101734 [Pedobacter soli]|uniref:Uncharacterized protein n=1 Tax=Pedobacter soli TaxID=390242 RepID=A0A1G6KCB0_9SPHI|nr:hypothetical protein SAMN04488024_101734 [Pedobacter soli]
MTFPISLSTSILEDANILILFLIYKPNSRILINKVFRYNYKLKMMAKKPNTAL